MTLVTEATMAEEALDKEILWNLQMMSEIVRSNGQELIRYKSHLVDVLEKSLRMTCKQGDIRSWCRSSVYSVYYRIGRFGHVC